MISVGNPAVLLAGVVFGLVPLTLHFISRSPPERRALPTARFLTVDPRTLLRVRRRPSDVLLLLVRVAFAVLLGAAFAGLTWSPRSSGDARVVLVDAGASSAAVWEGVADTVRSLVARDGGADARPLRVLAYGADGGSELLTVEAGRADGLDGVRPGPTPATFAQGLIALRRAVDARRWDRVEVTWVGPPTWDRWSPGLRFRRAALWPGAVELRSVPGPDGSPAVAGTPPVRLDALGDVVRPRVRAATAAAGAVEAPTEAGTPERPVVVLAESGPAPDGARVVSVDAVGRPRSWMLARGGAECTAGPVRPWGDLDADGVLVEVVVGLLDACAVRAGGAVPLDSGALAVLSSPDLPSQVSSAALPRTGRPLTPWVLIALLGLLVVELDLTRSPGRREPAVEVGP